jgi:hypothetical protein
MKKGSIFTEFLALIIEYSVKNLKKSNNHWKLKFSKKYTPKPVKNWIFSRSVNFMI